MCEQYQDLFLIKILLKRNLWSVNRIQDPLTDTNTNVKKAVQTPPKWTPK